MSALPKSWWLRLSERGFAFNFIAFSFAMFACLPTGFSATFSTLSVMFAAPIVVHRYRSVSFNLFEKIGLLLVGWLFMSVFWSDAHFGDALIYLAEYRIYLIIPVFIIALSANEAAQRWAIMAGIAGALFSLFASYGLGLGWWKINGADLSLGNRIYHGFIMSSLLLVSLLVAREYRGFKFVISVLIALLIIYNILNVETGRTAYLQLFAVCFGFLALTFSRTVSVSTILVTIGLIGLAYINLGKFHNQVNNTVSNIEKMVVDGDYRSSAGYRLEFYRGALLIAKDHLAFGVGVGDVSSALKSKSDSGEMRVFTDNVHSEFLNMLLAGGIPGFVLFCGFILAIGYSGLQTRGRSRLLGDMLIGISAIVFTSAIFNSTVKDYGEKHALMIMLSILGARMLMRKIDSVDSRVSDSKQLGQKFY